MLYYLPQDQLNIDHHQHIKKGTKTQQEIKKYLLPENLDEPKRILYLLLKGQSIQKRAAIEQLSATLKSYPYIISNTTSIIKQIISSLDYELQGLLIEQITKIVPKSNQKVMMEFSDLALRHLQEWKNQNITIKWLELIREIVLHSSFPEVEEEYINIATKLSGLKEILPLKLASVRLIGYLSFSLKGKLRGALLDRMRSFLRSEEKQLKLTILNQVMPNLFKNLTIQLIHMYFLQKIFQMIYDSEEEIKLSSIQLLISHIDSLSIDDKQRLSTIIIQHFEQSQYHSYFSGKIGQIYLKTHFQFQKKSDIGSFINSYKKLLLSSDPTIRYNALFNGPCLLLNMNYKLWIQIKEEYFDILLEDQDMKVKQIAILIYHEIVKIIGIGRFQEYYEMTSEIIESIQFGDSQIVCNFLEGYQILLKLTKQQQFEQKCKQLDTTSVDKIIDELENWIVSAISFFQQETKRYNSNTINKSFKILGQCAKYYQALFLQQQCLPLIYQQLEQHDRQVSQYVLDALCLIIYELVGKIHINQILQQIKSILLESNFTKKVTYIRFSQRLLNYLSSSKYQELCVYQNCVSLMDTKTLNIKLELVNYFKEATKYFKDANNQLNKLFEEQQIHCLLNKLDKPPIQSELQKITQRNSQCLRNQQQIKFQVLQKQDEKKEEDKKPNGSKPSLLHNKKQNRFNLFGKPTNPTQITINTLLAKQYRINKTLDGMKDHKQPLKKLMTNKIIQPQDRSTEKRKFQSFEIPANQNQKKAVIEIAKRRKTVNQNKYKI